MAFSFSKVLIFSVLSLFLCSCVSTFPNYGFVKYNETCTHSDHCIDYKMICARADDDEMRCLCSDILYVWSDQLQECIMDSNKLKRWLFRVQADSRESGELNNKELNDGFLALTLSGVLIAVSLLIYLSFLCVLFGCRIKNAHINKG